MSMQTHGSQHLEVTEIAERLRAIDPEQISGPELEALHSLIRKIHVARCLMSTYGPGWRRLAGSRPLEAGHWPLLADTLLHHAALPQADPPVAEARLGRSLKALNAALAVFDHPQAEGVDFGELPRQVVRRLQDFEGMQ